jgi:hypothetical protein
MAELLSDNFNRANETPLASPWIEFYVSGGNINLSSNEVAGAAATDCVWHNSGASTTDGYSQVTIATSSNYNGPIIRGQTGTTSCYFAYYGSNLARIYKFVNGAFTLISDSSWTSASGDIVKIEVSGTGLTYYINGASQVTGSNSDISGVGFGGIFMTVTTARLDNWSMGDLLSTGGNLAWITA